MTDPQVAHRSLRRAALAGAAAAAVLFVLLLTYFQPLRLAPKETLGNFYDAQAESFSHGHLTVDPAAVSFEGFKIGSRTYEYQGPVPALARLPIVLVTKRFVGRLTRLSMLAAFLLAMWFVVQLQLEGRRIVRGEVAAGRTEALWTGLTTFGLGASSLLFLASKAWVYHEALLWGAALSLGSLVQLLMWLASTDTGTADHAGVEAPRGHHLGWAALLAGLALLTRSSVGLGPVAALGFAALVQGWAALSRRRGRVATGSEEPGRIERLAGWRPRSTTGLAVLVLGVVLPIGVYAAVNQAKFGSLFSLPADKQVLVQFDPAAQQALSANHDSLFSPRFTPSVVLQALRPDALSFSDHFPFVGFPAHRPRALGGTLFEELDWSSSLTSSEPVLLLLGIAGLAVMLAPERLARSRHAAAFRIPIMGAAVGCAAFLLIGYIANRYLTDLFPFLALTSVLGLQALAARWAGRRSVARTATTAGLALLALWGAWANLGLGLEYQRVIAPGAPAGARSSWLRLQDDLGAKPSFVRIGLDQPLPVDPALGEIAVVGDCAGLYRSDGSIWQPVEGTGAVGQFDVDVTLSHAPTSTVTLLEGRGNAGIDRLSIERIGTGRFQFDASVERGGQLTRSLPGPPMTLAPGRTLHLIVTFDWRSGYAEVDQGPAQLLASDIALVPAIPSVDQAFPGTVREMNQSQSACRQLVR